MSLDNVNTTSSDLASQVARLSDADKREVASFIQNETQRAGIQESIHNLTAICFKKCVTSRISSGDLDKYEEPCMQNCAQRFVDASNITIRYLQRLNQGQ